MRFDPRSVMPPVTKNLIYINVIVLLAEWVLPKINFDIVYHFGMHDFASPAFRIWQLFTYMFLHDPGGFGHLFFNMFALWMFGSVIERTWGEKRYLIYYLITGIGAGLVQQLVWLLTGTPGITIGASGAVFGILLAFGMMYPNVEMFIWFVPIPVKAKWVVIGYGVLELFLGIRGISDGVAHFAHIGGMLFGIILILLWRNMDRAKRNKENDQWWA